MTASERSKRVRETASRWVKWVHKKTSGQGRKLRDTARRPSIRYVGMAVYIVVIGILIYTGGRLVLQLLKHPTNQCPDTSNVLPDYVLVAWGFAALIVGRYLGYLRYDEKWKSSGRGQRPRSTAWWSKTAWSKAWESKALGEFAFLAFLLVCTAALVYEAIGEQQSNISTAPSALGLAPITEYTRCAIYYDNIGGSRGIIPYVLVFAIFSLIGHWLWSYHSPDDFAATEGSQHPKARAGHSPANESVGVSPTVSDE